MTGFADWLLHVQGVKPLTVRKYVHAAGQWQRSGLSAAAYCNDQAVSASTRQARKAALRQWQAYQGTPLDLPKVRGAGAPQHRLLTVEDVTLLLDCMEYMPALDKAALMLLYCAGLRNSELRLAELADLDIAARRLIVTGKGGEQRTVGFNQRCAALLSNYIEQHRSESARGPQRIFNMPGGSELGLDELARMVRRVYRAALMLAPDAQARERLEWAANCQHPVHLLRHCFTSHRYAKGGIEARELQKMLGHKNLATTQRYIDIDPARLSKVWDDSDPLAAAQPRRRLKLAG